ncbi:MAG TPA: YciI family protein [Solirubrobacteraceae bacterium]|nr:YciI family protein [Solirubrobacteraceae bacterium]
MASYLILIYDDEAALERADQASARALLEAHREFGAANGAAISGGNALRSTESATSIRRDAAGELAVTDGPFIETKEALGGYYLIEAADLDEAIAIAKQVPVRAGGVEVRPIRVFD